VDIRLATPGDLPGIRAIADAYGNLAAWPQRPDYLDLELAEDGLWVATDGPRVVAFAGLLRRGRITHLGDMFVAPERRGAGVGGRLLAALPRTDPRTTFASADPRALPLYARWGLRPLAPLLYLAGERATGRLAAAPPTQRVSVTEAAERDAAASGGARPGVIALLERAGAHALAGATPGAYAFLRSYGDAMQIGPAAGDADDVRAYVAAALERAERVQIALPGPHPALVGLLDAGLRIESADTFMATEPGLVDLESYLPAVDLG
jgi:GNAT superfamily N-acetyltransferase